MGDSQVKTLVHHPRHWSWTARIIIGYVCLVFVVACWSVYRSTQTPTQGDLQKVLYAVCRSVNDGHDRSRIQASIITNQANTIKGIIARATIPRPDQTPEQRAASIAFRRYVFKQERKILYRANVFKHIKDTNCSEAK